eukprot:jgi/Bigna1/136697/aug1.35_g11405
MTTAQAASMMDARKFRDPILKAASTIRWEPKADTAQSRSYISYREAATDYKRYLAAMETIEMEEVERERTALFFHYMQNYFKTDDGKVERSGVTIYEPVNANTVNLMVKSSTLLSVGAEKAAAFLTGYTQRMQAWDDTFQEGDRKLVGPFKYLSRLTLGMPFPASSRDLVVYDKVMKFGKNVVSVFWDCKWDRYPSEKGYFPTFVRGSVTIGGYIFEDIGGHSCRVTQLLVADLKGALPKWMTALVQAEYAEKLSKLRSWFIKANMAGKDKAIGSWLDQTATDTASATENSEEQKEQDGKGNNLSPPSQTSLGGQGANQDRAVGDGGADAKVFGNEKLNMMNPSADAKATPRGDETPGNANQAHNKSSSGVPASAKLRRDGSNRKSGGGGRVPAGVANDPNTAHKSRQRSNKKRRSSATPIEAGSSREEASRDTNRAKAIKAVFSLARHGRTREVHKALLKHDLPASIIDAHGNNLLHIAAQNNNRKLAKWCLRYGVDIREVNKKGMCPIRYCMRYKYVELGEYLLHKQNQLEASSGTESFEAYQ